MEYCGHTVAFKTYSKSNKLKKRLETPKEQQLIFRDTHEAIVDEAVWERVQKVDIVWNFIGMVDFPNEPQTKTTTKEKTA